MNKIYNELYSKYRIHFSIILTILSIISILPLSKKVTDASQPTIFPQIILVSVVSIFIAITTYNKLYYPYSVILASVLLFVVYSLYGIFIPERISIYITSIWYSAGIDIFIIFSALWRKDKLGAVYPFALSIVLGIVMGITGRPSEGLLGVVFLTIGFIIIYGIVILVLCIQWLKSKSTGNYLILSATTTLSLIIFLTTMTITSEIQRMFLG